MSLMSVLCREKRETERGGGKINMLTDVGVCVCVCACVCVCVCVFCSHYFHPEAEVSRTS